MGVGSNMDLGMTKKKKSIPRKKRASKKKKLDLYAQYLKYIHTERVRAFYDL